MDAKIKKNFRFRVQSQCAWFGEIKAQHVLPNKFVQAIDPFVFLKHILSCEQSTTGEPRDITGAVLFLTSDELRLSQASQLLQTVVSIELANNGKENRTSITWIKKVIIK